MPWLQLQDTDLFYLPKVGLMQSICSSSRWQIRAYSMEFSITELNKLNGVCVCVLLSGFQARLARQASLQQSQVCVRVYLCICMYMWCLQPWISATRLWCFTSGIYTTTLDSLLFCFHSRLVSLQGSSQVAGCSERRPRLSQDPHAHEYVSPLFLYTSSVCWKVQCVQ